MALPGRVVRGLEGLFRDCLGHLNDKHGGSTFFALKNVAKFFPPWTLTRDVWQTALRPDVSGIAVDARVFHRYRVYKDPFPHPALRGGGGSASSSAVLRGSGYDHRQAYTAQDFHSCVGGAAWPGTSRLFFRVVHRLRI